MEKNAGRCNEFVQAVSRRAVGHGVGEVLRHQRISGEFRGHGHALRKGNVQRSIERRGAGCRRDAAKPEPGIYGGARGGIADAGRADGRSKKNAGYSGGAAASSDRRGGVPRAGAVRAGRGGRHRRVADRAERAGAKAAAWKTEPYDGSVCDQLQDTRAAKLSVGGRRSDHEGLSREKPGWKLRGG